MIFMAARGGGSRGCHPGHGQRKPTEGTEIPYGGNFRFLPREFSFPTLEISVFYVGNFGNCGTCKVAVPCKVRQVRKAIPKTELRGLCGLGVRAIREFWQLTQEVLSTDTRSCVNRQKNELRGRYRPIRTFAGTPDMFLPRVPPHTPVTVCRQKHIGPAKYLALAFASGWLVHCTSPDKRRLPRAIPPTPLDIHKKERQNRL